MKYCVNKRKIRLKLLKYIFLSASFCVLLTIIITLYQKNTEINQNSKDVSTKTSKATKPKEYNLAIDHLMFEGFNDKSVPYKILAKEVTKNQFNQYIMNSVSSQYSFNNKDDLTAKSMHGLFDEDNKLVILKDDVRVFLNNIVLNSEEIKINLKNQDIYSDELVEVNSKMGNIKADSFNTKESNNIIEFKGNVESTYTIKNSR